ncbi:MAG: hypothetical protein HYW27_00560 [Candidatus Aenigmarchaeota archaeon]|nr:hypothetical protein [Candidatus Aenigmarchaeota archaeon]
MEERRDERRKKGAGLIVIGLLFFILAFIIFTSFELPKGEFVKSLFFTVAAIVLIVIGKRSYHFG